jgi:hypothetical protein
MNLHRFLAGVAFLLTTSAFAADAPTVTFLGSPYTLSVVAAKDTFVLNQYFTGNDTQEQWTKRVSVGDWPKAVSPFDTIKAMVSVAKAYLLSQPQVITGPDGAKGDDLGLVFVQGNQSHTNMELDVERYVKEPGTPGIKWYQYAQHLDPNAPIPKPDAVNAWLDALKQVKLPLYTQMPSSGNTTTAPASSNTSAAPSPSSPPPAPTKTSS